VTGRPEAALVARGHRAQQRARPRNRRVQGQPGADRSFAQALGRTHKRRKTTPFRSALSMLVFYENPCGRRLPASRDARSERAKTERAGSTASPPGAAPARRHTTRAVARLNVTSGILLDPNARRSTEPASGACV